MRIGLAVYGTVFGMGLHPSSTRPAIAALQLLEHASMLGLAGIELPVRLIREEEVEAIAHVARERKLFISLAYDGFEAKRLEPALEMAARLGAESLRTVVGGAYLGGDRRPMAGRWQPFLRSVLEGFQETTQIAEQVGVDLAVENHQDLASEELLWLCETIASPRFGITLDTGSMLATAEEPVEFTARVARYVKNAHIKDYQLYLSEEGYRLVRCPIGQGVVNFPEIFALLAAQSPDLTLSIEIGALEARHVRVFSDDYWPDYPPRSAAQFAKLLRFVLVNAHAPGEWRTPFELGVDAEKIVAYEERQLMSSVAYLKMLQSSSEQF
jgi:sugar phosphate isomerase/epimerase